MENKEFETIVNFILKYPDKISEDNINDFKFIKMVSNAKSNILFEISKLKRLHNDKFDKFISFINNEMGKNVIGDVIEIEPSAEIYKNLLNVVKEENWIYNGLNVIQKEDKWLILFY